jgi:hypothetical protein
MNPDKEAEYIKEHKMVDHDSPDEEDDALEKRENRVKLSIPNKGVITRSRPRIKSIARM